MNPVAASPRKPGGDTLGRRVARLALAGVALAVAACSTPDGPYKRDKDPNAGGNGSMFRDGGSARGW